MERFIFIALSLTLFIVGCGRTEPKEIENEGDRTRGIIGGTLSNRPAIFFTGCTVSLVGPSVVVTAAHCRPLGKFVKFKSKGKLHVVRVFNHPSYRGGLNPDPHLGAYDVAIGILNEPVVGVAPMRISNNRTAGWHRFVGHGCTSQSGGGTGTETTGWGYWTGTLMNRLVQIFQYGNLVCHGDSGGPILGADGQIESVLSRGNFRGERVFYGAAVAHPNVIPFIKHVAKQYDVGVCGVTGGGCASAKLCKYKWGKSGKYFVEEQIGNTCDPVLNIANYPVCRYQRNERTGHYSKVGKATCFRPVKKEEVVD